MYLTFAFIVQIVVALYLLWINSASTNKDLAGRILYKFLPLVLAALLVVNAFGLAK